MEFSTTPLELTWKSGKMCPIFVEIVHFLFLFHHFHAERVFYLNTKTFRRLGLTLACELAVLTTFFTALGNWHRCQF